MNREPEKLTSTKEFETKYCPVGMLHLVLLQKWTSNKFSDKGKVISLKSTMNEIANAGVRFYEATYLKRAKQKGILYRDRWII